MENSTTHNISDPSIDEFDTVSLTFVAPTILFANALILVAINKSKKLQKPTFYLLGNLAVADGSMAFNLAIRLFLQYKFFGYGCLIFNCGVHFSLGSSLSAIMLVCLHNLITIRYYTFSKRGISLRLVKLSIAGTWLFWILLSIAGFITADVKEQNHHQSCNTANSSYASAYTQILLVVVVLTVVAIVIVQIYAILTIQHHMRVIQSDVRERTQPATTSVKLQIVKKAAQVTSILSLVLLLIVLSWGPVLTAYSIRVSCPSCGVTDTILKALTFLAFLNNFGNIMIYAAKSKEFRSAAWNALRRVLLCRQSRRSTQTSPQNGNDGTVQQQIHHIQVVPQ